MHRKKTTRQPSSRTQSTFENIARSSWPDGTYGERNDKHNVFLIEGTGMGAVIFDYDNDGWHDIFLRMALK